jgi:hypothetical protein
MRRKKMTNLYASGSVVKVAPPKEPQDWDGKCTDTSCELRCGIPFQHVKKGCRHPDARKKWAEKLGIAIEGVFCMPFKPLQDDDPNPECPLVSKVMSGLILGEQFVMDSYGRVDKAK